MEPLWWLKNNVGCEKLKETTTEQLVVVTVIYIGSTVGFLAKMDKFLAKSCPNFSLVLPTNPHYFLFLE